MANRKELVGPFDAPLEIRQIFCHTTICDLSLPIATLPIPNYCYSCCSAESVSIPFISLCLPTPNRWLLCRFRAATVIPLCLSDCRTACYIVMLASAVICTEPSVVWSAVSPLSICLTKVVNGTYSLQKEWLLSNHLEYDEEVRTWLWGQAGPAAPFWAVMG